VHLKKAICFVPTFSKHHTLKKAIRIGKKRSQTGNIIWDDGASRR
jgi:hypothetical protein